MGIRNFFKNAFNDMKESAKEQHQADRANFAAAKAESKAQFEEAKAMGRPETMKKFKKNSAMLRFRKQTNVSRQHRNGSTKQRTNKIFRGARRDSVALLLLIL